MTNRTLKVIAAAALIGTAALTLPGSAEAGYGHYHGYYGHGGWGWGAGLVGFGIGALVGSALAPREVYVAPPPPPAYRAYYGPAGYGPPPWSPGWYSYCRNLHGPYFNPETGYFQGAEGGWYFCR
jgi:hypothetical protein